MDHSKVKAILGPSWTGYFVLYTKIIPFLGVSESHFEIHKMFAMKLMCSLLLFRGCLEHPLRFWGHNHGASWGLKN